jgi:uncharacterized protein YprB with RNaseH-like and TPR domain
LLENTFIHIPGIGSPIEKLLWSRGCLTWQDALDGINEFSFGSAATDTVKEHLHKSQEFLAEGHHQYFARALGLKEAWRAWPHFKSKCTYLDIETDGGKSGNAITIVGCYDGLNFDAFVKGQNLESFRDYISRYSMVVTFFGSQFDIPMVLRRFDGLVIDHIHLDLCPTLRAVGVQGGLKKIEKTMGIARGDDTDGLTGYDAIKLWRRYQNFRDERALKTLVAYNREDVVNLETLAEIAYNMHKAETFDKTFSTDVSPEDIIEKELETE